MDYKKELFAQRTPYLQWLKGRDIVGNRDIKDTGKPVCVFPFSSCMDSVKSVLGGCQPDKEQSCLFVNEDGKLYEGACELIAKVFWGNPDACVVYADEDYFGTLEELYHIEENAFGEEVISEYERTDGLFRGEPWFKPDFSPDTLEAFFYIGNIFAIKGQVIAEITDELGDDISLYGLVKAIAHKIISAHDSRHGCDIFVHIPKVLYTNNRLSKKDVLDGWEPKKNIIKEDADLGRISVIIPSKDNPDVLKRCIESFALSAQNIDYELIIVDNGSSDENRMCINSFLQERGAQYIYQKMEFHFSKMCNMGAAAAHGKFLLFLNDDIEVCKGAHSAGWLQKMMYYAAMEHVGAVGIKLHYPQGDLIQHAGITNMKIGPAHKLGGVPDEGNLYHGHNLADYDMLAVTAACMLLAREKFERAGGFDEKLAVAYNDVELCFRLYQSGLYNVQVNSAFLIHHESLSRGQDTSAEKQARLLREKQRLYERHPWASPKSQVPDRFYSPNLVQWEKDVQYNVCYQYAYERTAELKQLSTEERQRLLKQENVRRKLKKISKFLERLYNKLTGISLHMLCIDGVEREGSSITIKGWHVLQKRDNAGLEKKLLLFDDNCMYETDLYPKLRQDVEELFAADSESTKNTALSGIYVRIDTTDLAGGSWQAAVLVESGGRKQLVTSSCHIGKR